MTLYAMGILTTRLIGHKMIFDSDQAGPVILLDFVPRFGRFGRFWVRRRWELRRPKRRP